MLKKLSKESFFYALMRISFTCNQRYNFLYFRWFLKQKELGDIMEQITSIKIAEILNYESNIKYAEINGVSTDSRKCSPRDVFIAVKGENFDGHNFVSDVINKGCPLVIVDHLIEQVPADKQIVVTDTLDAYGKIGAYNRSLFKGKVIGLTGSSGKTTTKEEIKFLLSKFGKTYATVGNHNNFVGVPESLCNMDMDADFAVIEMGMSAQGEISRLTSYVKPDIAIVTNVYPMHIEFFNEFKDIAYAKAEIFEGLAPKGIAIINEDANFYEVLEEIAKKYTDNIFKFGKNCNCDAVFETATPGEHHISNALCALKVIEVLGLDVKKAAKYVKDFKALEGRGKQYKLTLENGDTFTLIDDSYSGQPEAMKLAIKSLSDTQTTHRKIAVLGKMAELGALSQEKHIEIGNIVEQSDIDIVVGVCPEMKDMLDCVSDDKEKYYFENKEPLVDFLLNKLLQKDDIILIKGARYSSKLYQVVQELIKKGS